MTVVGRSKAVGLRPLSQCCGVAGAKQDFQGLQVCPSKLQGFVWNMPLPAWQGRQGAEAVPLAPTGGMAPKAYLYKA